MRACRHIAVAVIQHGGRRVLESRGNITYIAKIQEIFGQRSEPKNTQVQLELEKNKPPSNSFGENYGLRQSIAMGQSETSQF